MDANQLEDIETNSDSNEVRLRKMLTCWLRSPRTWTDVCNGLRNKTVEMNRLAKSIDGH